MNRIEHRLAYPGYLIRSYERRDFSKAPNTYKDEQFLTLIDHASGLAARSGQKIVVDIMSGPGGVGLALHKRHPEHVYCFIDLATGQLEKIAGEGLKGLKIQGDARKLPAMGEIFDVAVARYGIKDLRKEEQPVAIKELYRTLKPGGILVIADMVAPKPEVKAWLNMQHAKKQELSGRLRDEGVCHIPTETEWTQLLKNAGFETHIEGYHVSHVRTQDWVESKQITPNQLIEMNAIILNAPDAVKKIFHIRQDADGVNVDYPVVVVKAIKPNR